jgi:hypothetical protein
VSWAASRAWYSVSNLMPSFKRSTPSVFFSIPALKPGSKSLASFTLEPGLTRNGSMNRAICLDMSLAMGESSCGGDDASIGGDADLLRESHTTPAVRAGTGSKLASALRSAAKPPER